MNSLRQKLVQHNYLASTILAIVLFSILIWNGYGMYAYLSQANPQAPADPLSTLPTGDTLSGQIIQPSSGNWALVVAGLAALVFAIVLGLMYLVIHRRAKNRDQRRIDDLQLIKDGLEQYRGEYGHYPKSAGDKADLSTGVLIGSQWEAVGLPDNLVMASYVPGWPLTDPQISAVDAQQQGNYLYRPILSGQAYELYAYLERPGKLALDPDNLPESLLLYNYRLNSNPLSSDPVVATNPSDQANSGIDAQIQPPAGPTSEQAEAAPPSLDYSQFTLPSDQPAEPEPAAVQSAPLSENDELPPPISGQPAPPPATIEAPAAVMEPVALPSNAAYKPLSITMPNNPVEATPGGQTIAHAVNLDEERIIEMEAEEADDQRQAAGTEMEMPELFALFPEEGAG